MSLDITQVIFSTTIDTFMNELPNATGSLSVPAQSYTSGQTRSFSTTIPLDREDALAQIVHRYSFDDDKFYTASGTVTINANFRVITFFGTSGATLTVDSLVWNADASTHTSPAFTLDIIAKRFVGPFD